ncbi:D-tyrosyl-tRNA(Tyr) deacylase [Cladophialophora chaetospira]|uniref:D-aminoacyl-tRNA deacylase n=1 Tax=Cladophialophora chaetospira TaxID=386627 RepID=A0AA38XDZ9_9EURO|nr:D-tyrosyl-tRNA(Tyr) deacylase [Cladophialophora chaetospira]
MKAVLQRVASSSVTVNDQLVSSIGRGILVLAAVGPNDTRKDADSMASKVVKMKLWPDENGSHWKRNVKDVDGEILCVSQFTLLANTKKGNKPDFHGAAKSDFAKELYDYFVTRVKEMHGSDSVKDGVFQAMMQVALVNDGPVTIEIETIPPKKDTPSISGDGTGTSTPTIVADDDTNNLMKTFKA